MKVSDLVDFLFPPQCCACNAPGSGICAACVPITPAIERSLETLGVCALGRYEGNLRRAVLAIKNGRRDVADAAADRLAALVPAGSALIPVPTTFLRRIERGFDGCVGIAHRAARAAGAICIPGLRQSRGDRQRGRSRIARLGARGRFVWRGEAIRGMTVLLLDDVVTTGSTLEDCAAALRDAGARVERAIALAITP